MSRLDSAIRRLEAQRICLDLAAAAIEAVPGEVLEVGLGNGRTYDHLRERLPGRRIVAFDRQVAAHPDCVPPGDRLVLGDIRETLATRPPAGAALIHSDIGSGDAAATAALAAAVAPHYAQLLAPDGLVLSDQPLADARLETVPPPTGIAENRYFLYRRRG